MLCDIDFEKIPFWKLGQVRTGLDFTRVAKGYYKTTEDDPGFWLWGRNDKRSFQEFDLGISKLNFGIIDSPEQFIEKFGKNLENDPRPIAVFFSGNSTYNEEEFRKSGPYLGNQDEANIKGIVCCYNIYVVDNLPTLTKDCIESEDFKNLDIKKIARMNDRKERSIRLERYKTQKYLDIWEAADYLLTSVDFYIKLLKSEFINCDKLIKDNNIFVRYEDLVRYNDEFKIEQKEALAELTRQEQALGLYDV